MASTAKSHLATRSRTLIPLPLASWAASPTGSVGPSLPLDMMAVDQSRGHTLDQPSSQQCCENVCSMFCKLHLKFHCTLIAWKRGKRTSVCLSPALQLTQKVMRQCVVRRKPRSRVGISKKRQTQSSVASQCCVCAASASGDLLHDSTSHISEDLCLTSQ